MILEFDVENWFSFKDKISLGMTRGSKSRDNENFAKMCGEEIFKTAIICGPNGSGKTTLFMALRIVSEILTKSVYMKQEEKIPIKPFALNFDKPSKFNIKFISDNVKYQYGFAVKNGKICSEYLFYYPNNKKSKMFERVNDTLYFPQKDVSKLNNYINLVQSNRLFLGILGEYNYANAKSAYEFLTEKTAIYFSLEDSLDKSFECYARDEGIKKFALEFLNLTRFNIIDYEVKEVSITKDSFVNYPFKDNVAFDDFRCYQFHIIHEVNGENYKVDFSEESSGVKELILLIPIVYMASKNKKLLIIDNFGDTLEHTLFKYIINKFNANNKECQFIFNTNNLELMEDGVFRKDQIWFCEIQKEYKNVLYRLCNVNKV